MILFLSSEPCADVVADIYGSIFSFIPYYYKEHISCSYAINMEKTFSIIVIVGNIYLDCHNDVLDIYHKPEMKEELLYNRYA